MTLPSHWNASVYATDKNNRAERIKHKKRSSKDRDWSNWPVAQADMLNSSLEWTLQCATRRTEQRLGMCPSIISCRAWRHMPRPASNLDS